MCPIDYNRFVPSNTLVAGTELRILSITPQEMMSWYSCAISRIIVTGEVRAQVVSHPTLSDYQRDVPGMFVLLT